PGVPGLAARRARAPAAGRMTGSGADAQRRAELPQTGDDAEGGDAAGPRIVLGRHIGDAHAEARAVGLHLDLMGVALDGRVRPDLESGPIGADPGKAEGDRDVEIGREALGGLPGAAL